MENNARQQLFDSLLFHTRTDAFNAISLGNGIFIPVSRINNGTLEKYIFVRRPNWDMQLESITTSGSGIWSLNLKEDRDTLDMEIFRVPHIAYSDLIFLNKGDSIIFCDLQKKEAQECLFVRYERRAYSHYITMSFDGDERDFQCTNYGAKWACFPSI